MGTREDFLSSKANKREQTRRLFYMPWVLQPELRHDLDTEVFIFALRHYLLSLCKNTPFVTGRNHWEIILRPIFRTIGLEKATALPVLKGADNTDCCRVKGKPHAGKLSWKLKSLSVFLNLEVQVWFPGLRLRLQSRDLCVSFITLRQKYVLWQNWDDCFLGRKKLSRRGCHRTKLLFKKQSKESIINFYCGIMMW